MTRLYLLTATLISLLLLCSETLAQQDERRVRAVGRKSITITTPEIRFGDLAKISSPQIVDDEVVIGLQKIFIGSSPAPGESKTISAAEVLEKLSEQGVDTQSIGYALPRVMSVKRASRTIRLDEVREALSKTLKDMGREASIETIDYKEDTHVIPGEVRLEARALEGARPGFMDFQIQASSPGDKPVVFQVSASVNEWLKVPVARHPIPPGSMVTAGDVVMARLNIAAIPTDAEHKLTGIIGLRTSRKIGYGEVFRRNKLSVPPVVEAGAKVTMRYKTKYLEATASGVALEAGAEGDEIRVRNDASRKTVSGEVLGPGLVGVTQ